jgi:hypothetical protein
LKSLGKCGSKTGNVFKFGASLVGRGEERSVALPGLFNSENGFPLLEGVGSIIRDPKECMAIW